MCAIVRSQVALMIKSPVAQGEGLYCTSCSFTWTDEDRLVEETAWGYRGLPRCGRNLLGKGTYSEVRQNLSNMSETQ
jgi:hypothetical protein